MSERERKEERGRNPKLAALTESCREIIGTFQERTRTPESELEVPDKSELGSLIEHIRNPQNAEIKDHAEQDMHRALRFTRFWVAEFPSEEALEEGGLWSFIDEELEEGRAEEALDLLSEAVKNASKRQEEQVLTVLYNLFAPKIEDIATSSSYDTSARIKAIQVIDSLDRPEEEEWETYTSLMEELIEGGYATFLEFVKRLSNKFLKLREWDRTKYRDWFYGLMMAEDPEVKNRAGSFYDYLEEKHYSESKADSFDDFLEE